MGKYAPDTVEENNGNTDTPLHLDFYNETIDLDVINALLQVKTSVMHVKNKYGNNPMHTAISNEEIRLDVIEAPIQNDPSTVASERQCTYFYVVEK